MDPTTRTAIVATAALLIGLGALLAAPTATAEINTAPTRLDLEAHEPGDTIDREIWVRNRGDEPIEVEVEIETLHGESVEVVPGSFGLDGWENRTVQLRIELPDPTPGGRHDIRVRFVEVPADGSGDVQARSATLVPVVVPVRNLAVGNVRVADGGTRADVLVANHLERPARADVQAAVLADGEAVARGAVRTGEMAVGETRLVGVDLGTDGLDPGTYALRVDASNGSDVSNTWERTLRVGRAVIVLGNVTAAPGGADDVVLSATVQNDGNVEADVHVRFEVLDGEGTVLDRTADPVVVGPGEAREVAVEADLRPGDYEVRVTARTDEGVVANGSASFREPVASQDREGLFAIPAPGAAVVAGGAAIVVAAGAAAWIVRRRRD